MEVNPYLGPPVVIAIDDSSRVGEARRLAKSLAANLGFDETQSGKVALVATEAATNLNKHAKDGELIVQGISEGLLVGVEIRALDRGPGMSDVGRCMVDGFSTAGSPGTGFGAMSRLSSLLEVHSSPGSGTAIVARLWRTPPSASRDAGSLEVGVVNLPLAGEEVCGDAWALDDRPGRRMIMIADGLGHGLQAAEASREAVESFRKCVALDLGTEEILLAAHDSLRKTRGAAMAVARVDGERGEVRFCGVGNISGVILPREGRSASMMSHNGTVGHTIRKVREFVYPWSPGSLLVMHSDGLATHWQLDRYAGLASRHPSLISGILYRDFSRRRDDVTVVVAREWRAET